MTLGSNHKEIVNIKPFTSNSDLEPTEPTQRVAAKTNVKALLFAGAVFGTLAYFIYVSNQKSENSL